MNYRRLPLKLLSAFCIAALVAVPMLELTASAAPSRQASIRKRPGGRSPAGPRPSECFGKKSPVTLSPLPLRETDELTAARYPTFFVHVPDSKPGSVVTAEFALKNWETQKVIYTTTVNLAGKSGIMRLSLPATSPGLELGKTYQWMFMVGCNTASMNPDLIDATKSVTWGFVRRATPEQSLTNQLEQASPHDRFKLYKKSGFWYEALSILADLRRQNPSDASLAAEWKEMLKAVNLSEEVAAAPLIP